MSLFPKLIRRIHRRRGPKPPLAEGTTFQLANAYNWYQPVQLTASAVGRLATQPSTLREVRRIVGRLSPDEYVDYLNSYCEAGQSRFGGDWHFADILTTLWAATRLAQPSNYLEIGVRRGRSMAVVAGAAPDCHLVGFDLWVQGYAGMNNPGPDFVRRELAAVGHRGVVELISGDSHRTVKQYFASNPDVFFDLVTVDGDHTPRGARQDLRDVIPYLKRGGLLVFDDLVLPENPGLDRVWRREVVDRPEFQSWSFREVGYGVGVAIRV